MKNSLIRRNIAKLSLCITALTLGGVSVVGCGAENPSGATPNDGGAGGTAGSGGSSGSGGGGGPDCSVPIGFESPMRLLTRSQYDNAIKDLLGITGNPSKSFPKENKADGYENNSTSHAASPFLVNQYVDAAEAVTFEAMAGGYAGLLPCDPKEAGDEACGVAFLGPFVRKAFRRQPSEAELAIFDQLFKKELKLYGFDKALAHTIQAVIQSPQFLYRLEQDQAWQGNERHVVSSAVMASRLSFFLWNSLPDTDLLDAIDKNELQTVEQIQAQAKRMMSDPRFGQALRDFHRQWLHLDALKEQTKDTPEFNKDAAALKEEYIESAQLFIKSIYANPEATTVDLFTSNKYPISAKMAKLFRMPHKGSGYQTVAMDPRKYAGVLTHPGVMAHLAYANSSSPIHRGIFVREALFCAPIPPPPNDVVIEPPDPDPNATTRERFKAHTEKPECAACHSLIDPIGFGFENYDEIGRHRETENNLPIDSSGNLAGINEPNVEGDFTGGVELSAKLAQSKTVQRCMTRQWYRYAMGRPEKNADVCAVDEIQQKIEASGGRLQDIFVAIATSDAFRYAVAKEASAEKEANQ